MTDKPGRSTILFLDDHPHSIGDHVEMLDKYGLEAKVFSGPRGLVRALESWDRPAADIKAIIIDSHLPGISSLEEFGYSDVEIKDGHRAGEAIAKRYLLSDERFRRVPTIILTAFAEGNRKLDRLHPDGSALRILSKGEPREFEEFIRSLLVETPVLPDFSLGAVIQPVAKHRDGLSVTLIQPAYDRIVQLLMENPNLMYEIDPRKWEEIIAASYEQAGFDEVILTPRSGDLGRDVIAYKNGFGSVKFVEQVKAYGPGHVVTANDVRALAGVLLLEPDTSKAVFSTTSLFAPQLREDRLLKTVLPTRLELVDKTTLVNRLTWKY